MARWCAGATSKSMPATRPSRSGARWKRNSARRCNFLPSLRGAERRSNPCSSKDGLLRGVYHRARIRATRWLAMTVEAACVLAGTLLLLTAERFGELVVIFADEVDIALVLDCRGRRLQRVIEVGERF